MIYYKEARMLYYFMELMEAKMYPYEEGKKVRKKLYQLNEGDKEFKTKKINDKLKIWRIK